MRKRIYFSSATDTTKYTLQNLAFISFILILFFNFLRLVVTYAVNVPYFDDYSYLEYTLNLANSTNVYSFFNELISKHNGHGVLTAKLIFYLNYLISGEINFRHLIILGSFLIVPIFLFFVWVLRKNSLPLFFSLPIALFLFNPLYHENIIWAAATWQYTASFATCLTMYFLLTRKENWSFILAVILGFITTYTNGNGIVGFFIGTAIILPQNNYRRLTLWLIVILLTGILYYAHSSSGLALREGIETTSFLKTLVSFMGMAAIYLRLNMNDLIILGIGISITYIIITSYFGIKILSAKSSEIFKKIPANSSLLAIIAWLLFTGLCVAWTRGIPEFAIVQRYMIYSVMNLVILYTLILIISPIKYRILIGLSGILIGIISQFCAHLYCVSDIIYSRNSFWSDVYNLKNHRHVGGKIETMNNALCKQLFNDALQTKIYRFPQIPIPDSNEKLLKIQNPIIDSTTTFTFQKDTLESYSGILITSIFNDKVTLDESHPDNSFYIALKDGKTNQIHLMPTRPTPNLNRRQFLKNGNQFNQGIQGLVYEDNVAPGKYIIGLLTIQNQSVSLTFTNKEVEIGKIY